MHRKRDRDGNLTGKAATNPIMDTRLYVVQFPDGREVEYAVNVVAENMLAVCDEKGNQTLLLQHIVDHKKDGTALSEGESYLYLRGRKYDNRRMEAMR
jgi:hypothetical protein